MGSRANRTKGRTRAFLTMVFQLWDDMNLLHVWRCRTGTHCLSAPSKTVRTSRNWPFSGSMPLRMRAAFRSSRMGGYAARRCIESVTCSEVVIGIRTLFQEEKACDLNDRDCAGRGPELRIRIDYFILFFERRTRLNVPPSATWRAVRSTRLRWARRRGRS